jgi:signal transduction histidine kinase
MSVSFNRSQQNNKNHPRTSDESPTTVLTVDDNDAIRYSLGRYLREAGYLVLEARTGKEALELARRDPALITLDINLPDIDGFEVCRRLKSDPATCEIPVLHISASCVEPMHKVQGLDGGADAYLAEPLDKEELMATVKALLRMRQAQREAKKQTAEAERARKELSTINENLEARVKVRTAELEQRTAEVQELSSRLLQAQDEERRRISRELHDSTGQLLVALNMNLARLKDEWAQSNPETNRIIDDTNSVVNEMSRQLRTMSYLLHPPLLDEAGLTSALKWYVEGFATRSTIDVRLELPDDLGRLPQDLEITIFRLIQESLTNIHRHSGSKTAIIRVAKEEKEVQVEIADEGTGFTSPDGTERKARIGVGILGMKERVRRFGGTLDIASTETGTTVQATLPVA